MNKKTMSEQEAEAFLKGITRAELYDNPVIYTKGVRMTLISLGYDENWVNKTMRELLERKFKLAFDRTK